MTKEEETIERLNRFKTIKVLYGNTFAMHIEQLKVLQEDIETVLNMLKENSRENIQLKKQIDLMATTLSAICTGLSTVRDHFEKEYCEFINSDKDCCWKTDTSCKDCIKQYFERKVRDERN